jgi:DNA-binding MarR family transcriptional regulator
MADMIQKDRNYFKKGERHPNAKLTEKQAMAIIALCREDKLSQTNIAKLFSVSQATISSIWHKRTWEYLK